jgi:protein farnesyltransferase subunit beta
MAQGQARAGIPALFTELPAVQDPLATETTDLQNETLEKCLPFLRGVHASQKGPFNPRGVPALQREDHVAFLYDSLEDYPAAFAGLDASRPWMVYWALAALSLLGEDASNFRDR